MCIRTIRYTQTNKARTAASTYSGTLIEPIRARNALTSSLLDLVARVAYQEGGNNSLGRAILDAGFLEMLATLRQQDRRDGDALSTVELYRVMQSFSGCGSSVIAKVATHAVADLVPIPRLLRIAGTILRQGLMSKHAKIRAWMIESAVFHRQELLSDFVCLLGKENRRRISRMYRRS